MRMFTRLIVIPAILELLVVTGSTASSLDRAGIWSWTKPTPLPPQASAPGGYLINDGSFEFGPPPASAWTEVSDPICERIGDFSGTWYVTAIHGTQDYWAGGYCDGGSGNVPVTSSVTQTITVPPASTSWLTFHYIALRPDPDDVPDDGDRVYLTVNGVEVWSLPLVRANDNYPTWSEPVKVDMSAYSDQSVSLSFGGVSVGDVTGNARIDYIQIIADLGPVEPSTWGRVKATFEVFGE